MKKYCFLNFIICGTVFALIIGCDPSPDPLFKLHSSDRTGIDFSNTIFESDSFNILTYEYIYNGGGVAIADFNNDGLQDVFFTGNMVPSRLYLNNGHFRFTDVTETARVGLPDRWSGGVTVVDINNDGWQDLYVCATMKKDSLLRANMLFLNKGVDKDNTPVFEEVAERYGIADNGYSIMASFFDYDKDGDLDLYVLTNKHSEKLASNYLRKVVDGSSPTNDRLYRNNGDGTFTNVSKEAGILYEGFGLGLAISDFNNDGWPDIYASNDFLTNDLLYINNQDGTFSNEIQNLIGHQSQFSMGNDAADFNNDGLTDIITTDMLPESNERKKTMISDKSYLTYINNEKYGYEYQYTRNMLHLNNDVREGVGFSEIGQLSGVFQTEWSWSALFADFDNDGLKDLALTNGFPKDITDKDFVKYRADVGAYLSKARLLDSVPVIKLHNYLYKNNGDLTFSDVSKAWGFTQQTFSNGAAYVDLDNDGDLDYIVNNINDEALVYENRGKPKESNHYLRIKLNGPPMNINAIGTKVTLYSQAGVQIVEQFIARGYLSSVERIVHFGLGKINKVDSLVVNWPDGNVQKIIPANVDQVELIAYDPDKFLTRPLAKRHEEKIFEEVSQSTKLLFRHEEDDKIDFNVQRTLPHKFSQLGPGIAIGDVNGDGREDVVVGGSVGHYFTVFSQTDNGTFKERKYAGSTSDKKEEDQGLLLFDAEGDGDLDLYVVSGGFESTPDSPDFQDRLYRNDGKGKFLLDSDALPIIRSSGSCIRAADFDGDGDLDLFVGGRVVPGSYPLPARSYLLLNDNGKFTDVTDSLAPDLSLLGLVTDALFTDFDNNGTPDLIVVGEFLPITLFKNNNGRFIKSIDSGLEAKVGWWNSIIGGDFDNDGDTDYVVGNLGLNNCYQVSDTTPLCVFAKDFDKNGSVDALLACYIKRSLTDENKDLFPIHFWDELNSQSPKFRQQFSKYKQYGKANMAMVLSEEERDGALILKANYLESSYMENLGDGRFKIIALPQQAQIAPVNGIVADDVNLDGNLDLLMIGNDFGNEVFAGRYDAFTGLVLIGDGKGGFQVSSSSHSGFNVRGDSKALGRLTLETSDLFIATRNSDSLSVFRVRENQPRQYLIPKSGDRQAILTYKDGRKSKIEFYYGAGYLSQSSRRIKLTNEVIEVIFHDSQGDQRVVKLSPI